MIEMMGMVMVDGDNEEAGDDDDDGYVDVDDDDSVCVCVILLNRCWSGRAFESRFIDEKINRNQGNVKEYQCHYETEGPLCPFTPHWCSHAHTHTHTHTQREGYALAGNLVYIRY